MNQLENGKIISEIKCTIPKFLQNDKDVKITNAQKGTLIHLCLQKLELKQTNYTMNQINEMIAELQNKGLITEKERDAININKIYQFTKSKIWKEMIHASSVYREKTFYISIPIKEIFDVDTEESILVQGIIDLFYINSYNELILVDFKTDYVENKDEQLLINKYKVQLDLYKKALEEAFKRKVDKVYIYSTYLDKSIPIL